MNSKPGSVMDATSTASNNMVEAVDVEAVNRADDRHLFESRKAIHPKLAHGFFRRIKWAALVTMLGIYYILPWVRWDRGPSAPNQAVLVDFPHQRFYFFFIEIWPQEVYYITGLLILAAVGLFLVTSLFGRVWCGFACPQTIWTDLFIAVERLVEGDRNKRLRLDQQPWTMGKVIKKVTKHSTWILIAMATGGAWIFYFHDAPTLIKQFFVLEAPLTAYIFMALLTGTTYLLAGFAREQVCTFMCPWPRIQAAMIDEDSLNVMYRDDRGEPRGPHKKNESWEGRGHCIDCKQCVAVCPMGIDIRDGDQLECIQCALCIDACNGVMTKIDLPKGLIAYDTGKNFAARAAGQKQKYNLLRLRIAMYTAVLILVSSIMVFGLLNRTILELNIQRDRNPLYVTLSDGQVRNGYTVKILNKKSTERVFSLTVKGVKAARMRLIGFPEDQSPPLITVKPDSLRAVRVFITLPALEPGAFSLPVTFTATDIGDRTTAQTENVFVGGKP